MAFARVKDSRQSRGYGKDHDAERALRLTYITPADLCGWCRRPLGPELLGYDRRGRRVSNWHLPHNRTRTGYLPGMWHAACNRREGAQAGRDRQTVTARHM